MSEHIYWTKHGNYDKYNNHALQHNLLICINVVNEKDAIY